MSLPLFDMPPAALIYRHPTDVPMHKMRCRDCHELRTISGGGSTPAIHDVTGGGGYSTAVCVSCFATALGRRVGISGRDVIEITEPTER